MSFSESSIYSNHAKVGIVLDSLELSEDASSDHVPIHKRAKSWLFNGVRYLLASLGDVDIQSETGSFSLEGKKKEFQERSFNDVGEQNSIFLEHLLEVQTAGTSLEELTLDSIKNINRNLNRKCSYRYLLFQKSAKHYRFKNLYFSTVPLVLLGLVNATLACVSLIIADQGFILSTIIIIFSLLHSLWKSTCHKLDYEKSAQKFENLALHMDMLALEAALSLAKIKRQAEMLIEYKSHDQISTKIDLKTEKKDLISFLEKSSRIEQKMSQDLKMVPKKVKMEVDLEISRLKQKGGICRVGVEGKVEVVAEYLALSDL